MRTETKTYATSAAADLRDAMSQLIGSLDR